MAHDYLEAVCALDVKRARTKDVIWLTVRNTYGTVGMKKERRWWKVRKVDLARMLGVVRTTATNVIEEAVKTGAIEYRTHADGSCLLKPNSTIADWRGLPAGWSTSVDTKSTSVDTKSTSVDTKSTSVDTKSTSVDKNRGVLSHGERRKEKGRKGEGNNGTESDFRVRWKGFIALAKKREIPKVYNLEAKGLFEKDAGRGLRIAELLMECPERQLDYAIQTFADLDQQTDLKFRKTSAVSIAECLLDNAKATPEIWRNILPEKLLGRGELMERIRANAEAISKAGNNGEAKALRVERDKLSAQWRKAGYKLEEKC